MAESRWLELTEEALRALVASDLTGRMAAAVVRRQSHIEPP
jgi:hypothetical protein